jgi:2,3-bisphosphoglycerate-dependent phosphoglycerate mutase
MQLYLIRHAQSFNNALPKERQHERSHDAPLTEYGIRQAELLAQHLVTGFNPGSPAQNRPDGLGYDLTRLYCSPMWRTLRTAQFIAGALAITPEVWIDLHEQGGVFLEDRETGAVTGYPGKTRQEMQAEFPGYILPDGVTEAGWWSGGYEDQPACDGRAIRVVEKLRTWADTDERIALVSHAGFLDALLKALYHMLPSRGLFYYHHNTAISRIDLHGDDDLVTRYLNRVDHLPPELLTL